MNQVEAMALSLKNAKEQFKAIALPYFWDKSIPLDERWRVFSECDPAFLPDDGSTVSYDILEKHDVSYYDDFYIERYKTFDVVRFFDYDFVQKLSIEEQNALKEEILETGVRTFVEDW